VDVYRLDPVTYLPNSLVEGYSSMIWTERYVDNGEFQMKTPNVAAAMSLLPELTPITLRDSNEVMFVETHSIDVDDKGDKELTITGRTFETFLENRVMVAAVYNTQWATLQAYMTCDFVMFLLWNNLVNSTGEDPSRAATTQDALTAVPGVVITDSTTITDVAKNWWIDEGGVYQPIRDILALGGLGIRNIRPSTPGATAKVTTFDTTRTASRGAISKVSTPNISQLRVDAYNGFDRRRTQAVIPPVIFHYDSGHIDSPKYLFSSKDLKNQAKISASFGNVDVWLATGTVPPTPNPTGLARRVMFIDGGDIGTQVYATFLASIVQKAQIELVKNLRQVLFDGAISPISPYKYGVDYLLGDKVTLLAEYGMELSMLVSEYVRTEDQAGDRGYPTLILTA
jgi:Siphovirus ReqiPepy6 Gp37-like protein